VAHHARHIRHLPRRDLFPHAWGQKVIAPESSFHLGLRAMRSSRPKRTPRCKPHKIVIPFRRSRCDCGFFKTRARGKYFLREKFCVDLEKTVTDKTAFPMLAHSLAAKPVSVVNNL
jgi:hypothetical protein